MLICVAACTLWRQPLYLIPTGDRMIAGLVSRQAIISPKTRTVLGNDSHQSTIFSAINKKLLLSALFWQGSGNGRVPCCTKRIMKTKQLWQVWNLRTHPQRHEDYQSQAVCWRGGSLLFCVPLWMWRKRHKKNQEKKNRNWVLPLVLKADTWQDDTSQSGSRQCRTEKGPPTSRGYFIFGETQ